MGVGISGGIWLLLMRCAFSGCIQKFLQHLVLLVDLLEKTLPLLLSQTELDLPLEIVEVPAVLNLLT